MTGNVLAVILAYFLGAIPMGVILGKVFKGVDIREYGSGRTGAANVLRSLGIKATVFVLAFDIGKGIAAVFIGKGLGDAVYVEALAGLAAVGGHNWSVFIRFSGGRGVSTGLGGVFAMAPPWAAGALGTGFLLIGLSRYVSVGSMSGTLFAFAAMLALALTGNAPWEYLGYAAAVTGLIIFQHRGNIGRLLKGQERRLGQKAEGRQPLGTSADVR